MRIGALTLLLLCTLFSVKASIGQMVVASFWSFSQSYTTSNCIVPKRTFSPMGWEESNLVLIMDSTQYWYKMKDIVY